MAAELRLNVALDLAFFKQQLPKLTQAAAGYSLPINVRINRQGLQQEVNYLSGYFRRKNYRIEVATNLDAEIKKAKDLIEELSKVDRALRAPTVAATRGSLPLGRLAGVKGQGTQIGASDLKKLYRAAADAGLLEFKSAAAKSKASIVKELEQIGEDAFIGLLNGLDSQDEKIKNAVKTLGQDLLKTIKAELGIASPSKKFMEIGKDAILGFEIGLTGGLRSLRPRAIREMRNLVAALQFEASKLMMPAMSARAGSGAMFAPGRQGMLPPAGMGRLDLNARRGFAGIPRVASSTGATGRMPMLPSSAVQTYQMAGQQLALPSAEMRAAEAAAKVRERASDAGRELSRSLREAAASIRTRFGARVPGSGIRFNRDQLAGYTAPVGPLPLGSAEPWAKSFGAGYMGGGFEPYMQSRVQSLRSILQGQKPLEAPAIGNRNVAESIASAQQQLKATQPIANRLREAAIEFSKNAPIVAQYLNSFRARKINISDLPGAGESPGQYIRRIQEAMRQGPFGAGITISGGGGGFRFGQGSQVPGFPLQRALPPAGATTAAGRPGYPFDRVTGGMGGSGGGGRGGAIVPYAPRTELPAGYFTGGKIQQALKGADQYLRQSRVPLTGAIQELGSEFGNAVKQVLLFGTAYKALAFIINLPNQALAAATSLQTFNNQLLAVTGNAGAANQAFSFVDGLAERFNVPLESARQGFVRLYASMEPAGFAPDQIEGLFTGISKAAATFGLSADQVDRVTYAFSQMASKGQAMSEELKGQLGDVLPGSLALFARAAQMSIPEFTKALEDGAFKGEAFQALLRNVAKLMNTEFAGGAAGAADTLQGRMNDLSNSVTKMYESFEPLVGLISAQVFPQLSGIISDATEAIQAFVGGIEGAEDPAAQLSSRGLAIYEALRQVADIGQSLQGIISALAPTFGALGQMILGTVQAVAQLLNTKAGQWLAKFALQVAAATAALQLMARVGLFNAIAGLIRFVTNIRGSIAALKVMITTTRIAKIALGGLVAGGIMVGLEMLAGKLTNVGSAARDAAAEARRLRDELDAAAAAGDVAAVGTQYLEANTALAAARKERDKATEARRKAETVPPDPLGLSAARLAGARQAEQRAQAKVNEAIRTVDAARRARDIAAQRRLDQQQQQGGLEAIDLSGETEKDAGKTKKSAKALKERVDMSNEELALRQKIRQQEAGIEQGLDHYNKLKLIQLNLELELLRVRESDMLMNEKYNAMQEAQRKADSERAKIFIDLGEATKDQMEENQRMSVEYKDILLESQYAAGLITQSEYEQNKALSQRLGLVRRIQEMQNVGAITPSQATAAIGTIQAAPLPGTFEAYAASLKREFDNLTSPINQLKTAIDGIGSAFEDAFSSAITGATSAQESLSQFFGNVGKMFADMATRMLSQWLVMKAVGLVGSLFGGGTTMGGPGYFDPKTGLGTAGPNFGLANGGVINGHFKPIKAFATGGVVNGPTLGLVGEGRFNEAVVPLPNGKSIPVDLGKNAAGNVSTNIVVNVNNGQTSSRVSGSQGNQLAKNLEGAVKEVIMRETRPGGIIYSSR